MKRVLLTSILSLLMVCSAWADGGMWLLQQLENKHPEMQAQGLELSALDLYNPNGASIKDAVVMFDGGCTGVIVSNQGLVLTNHHCGYDQIQQHSSVDHNYLQNGFWAKDFAQEIPSPGLEVELVDKIVDVTKEVKALLKADGLENSLQALSPTHLATYAPKIAGSKNTARKGMKYVVKAFYGGNKYLMFVNKVYRDVRFVAAPPSSIGKFGADTDNWMWPRHTGDFSIFRIYSDAEGNPVEYSAKNVPLKSKRFVKVSTEGVKEGDFALIMGFPGTTYRFFTAPEVDVWSQLDNLIRIEMRGLKQEVMLRHMLADEKTNIQYAAKYARSQNGYKRAQGANWAIKQRGLRETKLAQQNELLAWAAKNSRQKETIGQAVKDLEQLVQAKYNIHRHWIYLVEGFFSSMEFFDIPFFSSSDLAAASNSKEWNQAKQRMKTAYASFYNKDYSPVVDREVTQVLLERYTQKVDRSLWPSVLIKGMDQYGSAKAYVDFLFKNSIYLSPVEFDRALEQKDLQKIVQDPLAQFVASVIETAQDVNGQLQSYNPQIAMAQRAYIAGMMEMHGSDNLWPDANLTLRFTYGKVQGYHPRDNVFYGHQTTLEGVMEKEDADSWEFEVNPLLKEIYQTKNYGSYANTNGSMPVNFCASTHTTGGNSGSPVLNKRGELIGLNFDRNWEGVGGDIEYLPNYQRSIILDIRYLLLIVDKYGHSSRLLQEMGIH